MADGEESLTAHSQPMRTITNDGEMLAALAEFYFRNLNVIGTGDILALGDGDISVRAGMVIAVLAGIAFEDGERAIQQYLVVIPTGADEAKANDTVWRMFERGFAKFAGRRLTDEENSWFRGHLAIVAATDARHGSLIELVRAQPPRTAIIVTDAGAYRDDGVAPFVPEGAQTPLIPEDVWAPQVHALAMAAEVLAEERDLYVALDVNQLTPIRPELEKLLRSVARFGVVGSSADQRAETIISRRVDEWDRWIAAGHVGRALSDVDALPPVANSQKAFLKLQLMHKAGLRLEALALIRSEFLTRDSLDASTRVRLGRIAETAGAARLAAELIEPCIEELESREDLESALGTFEDRDVALADRIAARLESRFPQAEGVRRHRRQQLLRARDYAGLADALRPDDPIRATFYDRLAGAFAGSGIPDYPGLINGAADASDSEAFRMASAQDALSRGLSMHAFDLVRAPTKLPAQNARWEWLAMEVLERGFLEAGPGGMPAAGTDATQELFGHLIERLAGDPMNSSLRSGLVDLLKPEVAGSTGIALAAAHVLDLASRPVAVAKGTPLGSAGMEWMLDHRPFMHRALNWLESEQPIIVGRLALPEALLTEDPNDAIGAIASYLERSPVANDSDVRGLQIYLALAAAIAPHASDPDIDLRLYRLASGKIASDGFAQHARDLVELAIQNGTGTSRRRRLAWFAVADVYHRTQDHLAGLVALACAFAADDRADEEELWQEFFALARYLRDIGLFDLALEAVDRGRELLQRMELTDTYGHRLDLLAVQVRVQQRDRHDKAELKSLIGEVMAVARQVLDHGDMTAPSGIMLGQLLREARHLCVEIPEDAEPLFAELSKWAGGNLAAMIAATSAPAPTADQLAALVQSMPPARYAEDVGYDMERIATLAARALATDELLSKPDDTSFALELQADLGTALPNWDEAAQPPAAPAREAAAEIARELSRQGSDLLQLGFDIDGKLIRLATSGGAVGAPDRQGQEAFSRPAFHFWSQEFPRRYGYDESPNLFYRTTEALQLGWSPVRPTIICASSELQSFPAGILYDGRQFFGRSVAIASVPSLVWLAGARERNFRGDGRRLAWISTAEGDDGRITLALLAQRLEGPFADYGFVVDNSANLPTAFAGASMAVLTAHGGVHPEGRFFQLVSDEGVLKVSAADLAAAVRNISLVILFICSGGRADKHPSANTTLGLAKQVLDRGCSAVIASPWPLDSQVPPHWLSAFLARWDAGDTLMDAAFAANQKVDGHFAFDPARGLAMHVYGDGLLRKA